MTKIDLDDALYWACYESNLEEVQKALKKGADVNAVCRSQATPLIASLQRCGTGHQNAIVQLLLQAGADVNVKDSEDLSPLQLAWSLKLQEPARMILEKNPDLTVRGPKDGSLLHFVCAYEIPDKIEFLLNNGFEVDARDREMSTPLHLAARNGNITACRLLLAHGADPCAFNNVKRTPLHCVIESSSSHTEEICRILIENGADVHVESKNRNTPLKTAIALGSHGVLQILLDAGANPSQDIFIENSERKRTRMSPLAYVDYIARDDADSLKKDKLLLIAYGADPAELPKNMQVNQLRAAVTLGLKNRTLQLMQQGHPIAATARSKNMVDLAKQCGHLELAAMMQAEIAKRAIDELMHSHVDTKLFGTSGH